MEAVFQSLTISVPDAPRLTQLLRPGALCWMRRGQGMLGFGNAIRAKFSGPERFAQAQEWWRAWCANTRFDGTGPVAMGSFSFAGQSHYESVLVVPQLLVRQSKHGTTVTLTTSLEQAEPLSEADVNSQWQQLLGQAVTRSVAVTSTGTEATAKELSEPPQLKTGSLTPQQWRRQVGEAVSTIRSGALNKVVLARDVVANVAGRLNREQLLQNLSRAYPECWTFGIGSFVGATPEMLIEVHHGVAHARVLAGTVDRLSAPPSDVATYIRTELVDSAKQTHEHRLAVQSLTDRLTPFVEDLRTPLAPFVLELPNVWHLATDVYATLAATTEKLGSHIPAVLAMVEALHPTAAVGGSPRQAAVKLIEDLEHLDRGPYAGPVGWIDAHGDGEWGIGLRSGVISDDERSVRLFAGCGIVADSDPEQELAETEAKLRPMIQALGL